MSPRKSALADALTSVLNQIGVNERTFCRGQQQSLYNMLRELDEKSTEIKRRLSQFNPTEDHMLTEDTIESQKEQLKELDYLAKQIYWVKKLMPKCDPSTGIVESEQAAIQRSQEELQNRLLGIKGIGESFEGDLTEALGLPPSQQEAIKVIQTLGRDNVQSRLEEYYKNKNVPSDLIRLKVGRIIRHLNTANIF